MLLYLGRQKGQSAGTIKIVLEEFKFRLQRVGLTVLLLARQRRRKRTLDRYALDRQTDIQLGIFTLQYLCIDAVVLLFGQVYR